jgi:thiol-disulfide isomerase/thioredoxin
VAHILGDVLTMRRRDGGGRRARLAAVPALVMVAGLVLSGCSSSENKADATLGGFGFVQQSAGEDFSAPGHRKAAPDLSGTTLTGQKLDLASLRGKIVVVNFWASWCAPCRAESPSLVQLAAENPNVAFLGVDKESEASPGLAFVKSNKVPYPSILDELGTLAAHWPIAPTLPSTFVLDPQGNIAARFISPVTTDTLGPVLDKVAAET